MKMSVNTFTFWNYFCVGFELELELEWMVSDVKGGRYVDVLVG